MCCSLGGHVTTTGLAVIMLLTGGLTACTSSDNGGSSNSQAPLGGSGASTATGPCLKADAKSTQQVSITAAGFSPSCVRIEVTTHFFFVDGEARDHTASTRPGAPVTFDADLPEKGSTYAAVFKKKGKYVVVDKTTDKTMTLYVG